MKVHVNQHFIDSRGHRLIGAGERDVDRATAQRWIADGKAVAVDEESEAVSEEISSGRPKQIPGQGSDNDPKDPPAETPLPKNFPSRDKLAAAGFETVESIRAMTGPDELGAKVPGLNKSEITRIGLAVSQL